MKSQQTEQYAKTEQYLIRLSGDLAKCHLPLSDQLKSEIEKVIKANEESHALSRQHLENHVTVALEGLELSRNDENRQQVRLQEAQQQHERFLESLAYDEMNRRMNEISESHAETFEWVFDGSIAHLWKNSDYFSNWLTGRGKLFWINGKAGSGKSTLMKFIAEHPRTGELLSIWSSGSQVVIVTFYFWLSGSKMQRSLKAFLCNVILQILLHNRSLIETLFQANQLLLRKRNIDDWSVSELRQLLVQITDLLCCLICIFVDGLDEFDQDDEIEDLVHIIRKLSMVDKIKVCVSSRPEIYFVNRFAAYKKLRLQDLTAKDIEKYIRDELERCYTYNSFAAVDEVGVSKIVDTMIEKADGVFLWVHYAIKSVTRGFQRVDNLEELLDRIRELPNGMHQLYLQMWERLNGDDQRYRDEAATYFWYASMSDNNRSIFELWVSLNQEIQTRYLTGLTRLDPVEVTNACAKLEKRITTRCAGLLEISHNSIMECDPDEWDSEKRRLLMFHFGSGR